MKATSTTKKVWQRKHLITFFPEIPSLQIDEIWKDVSSLEVSLQNSFQNLADYEKRFFQTALLQRKQVNQ
jgi:hypothetical protein